jgi:dolichol-phosphate mannosyltransferase
MDRRLASPTGRPYPPEAKLDHTSQVSIVVPCYNEEEVIAETHRRLRAVANDVEDARIEILYVDDGSTDRTLEKLRVLNRQENCVRVVSLSRNYGHQVAITAGLHNADGDAVILIDADLQDPPEVIPEMMKKWRDGYDVVYGVRASRDGETPFKLWTAKAFYRFINHLSETEIPLDTGDFRLIDRKVVNAFKEMPERDRFVRGMISWLGFRQTPFRYERSSRFAGETKYPFTKMVRFALDGILSFSMVPLRVATYAGFGASAVAVLGIVYALGLRLFTNIWVPGWTALMIAVLFMGGVQLLSLGIIGEYVGRIYGESKRRPLYLVDAYLGFDSPHPTASPPPSQNDTRGRAERHRVEDNRL